MYSNDSCPLCEVTQRFHDIAVSQRDAARRERDDLIRENEILRAREEGEPWASAKICRERDEAVARADNAHAALRATEQRELEALAALDEALALIRTILDADCLQPHAFEKGDDDASVYQTCQHLLRSYMR